MYSDQFEPMHIDYEVLVGDCLHSETTSYKVERILGAGSFGQVCLCHKAGSSKMVALKVIRNLEDCGIGLNEAKILKNLQMNNSGRHHIVQCVDSFQYEGRYCFEFEMMDVDLEELLLYFDVRFELKEIRAIIAQMARALQHLKNVGIIHCDLKLNNIMMVDNKEQPLKIKLIDFGVARLAEEVKQGEMTNLRRYRAPEVQVGGWITEAADVWALGCNMAELLLGHFLFNPSDDNDVMKHIVEIVGQPPKHVLDSGKQTHKFFHKSKESGNWLYSWKQSESPQPLTVSSLDEIFRRYRFDGEQERTMEEIHDCSLFVNLLRHMLDPDPVCRYTPEDILNHPFVTMTHLKKRFPIYYAECQQIMDRVMTDTDEEEQVSPSTSYMTQKPSHTPKKKLKGILLKEKRKQTEELPRKRLKKRSPTPKKMEIGDEAPKKRPGEECTGILLKEKPVELPRKRLRKRSPTPKKMEIGDEASKKRPIEENTGFENSDREEKRRTLWKKMRKMRPTTKMTPRKECTVILLKEKTEEYPWNRLRKRSHTPEKMEIGDEPPKKRLRVDNTGFENSQKEEKRRALWKKMLKMRPNPKKRPRDHLGTGR